MSKFDRSLAVNLKSSSYIKTIGVSWIILWLLIFKKNKTFQFFCRKFESRSRLSYYNCNRKYLNLRLQKGHFQWPLTSKRPPVSSNGLWLQRTYETPRPVPVLVHVKVLHVLEHLRPQKGHLFQWPLTSKRPILPMAFDFLVHVWRYCTFWNKSHVFTNR